MSKLLIIEDNLVLCRLLCNWLEKKGVQTEYTTSAVTARKMIAATDADLILSDIRLPDGDGVEILEWMKSQDYRIPYVVMTDYAEVSSAVRAMKLGAEDYLPKPVSPEKLYEVFTNLLNRKRNAEESRAGIFRRESKRVLEAERHARLVAATDMSVLIRGENGTGKEHIAQLIHAASNRWDKPFVAVNCGAIHRELAASEFFGHAKGSFTGAAESKTGFFHAAEGGTLFLDEVGNLSYEVQTLLLRVLQEHRYRPVGGKQELSTDVRVVAATNAHLEKDIEEGYFREDLYHRLNEFCIQMPSLAECREDILPLADFFRKQFSKELNKETTGFDTEADESLSAYGWPGNIRELRSCVKRAVLLTESTVISREDLKPDTANGNEATEHLLPLDKEAGEKWRITQAMERCGGNKKKAAQLLGIDRATLYRKLEKYGLKEE